MALGKLWNAFFGKRTDEPTAPAASERSAAADRVSGTPSPAQPALRSNASSAEPARVVEAIAGAADTVTVTGSKTRRAKTSTGKKKIAVKPELTVAATTTTEPPVVKRSVPVPKTNSWTKLLGGRSVGTILETRLGQAARAGEVLEAIVCDSVPTPKLVAIDTFDMADGGITVLQFHQRIRAAGGQAVPVPGSVPDGLRQISRTLGTVDLLLWEPHNAQWSEAETLRLLTRVTHPGTVVLRESTGGRWEAVSINAITAVSRTPETRAA